MLETSKAFTLPISPSRQGTLASLVPSVGRPPPLLCVRSRGGASPGFMFAGVKIKGENLKV